MRKIGLVCLALTDTRLKTREKPKLPLPQPPPPNPLAHVREPKVRFSIADDNSQAIQHSGGSAYTVPGDTFYLGGQQQQMGRQINRGFRDRLEEVTV